MTSLVREVAARPPLSRTARHLSPTKGDAPHLVCLDIRDWIGLAQAHYGRNPAQGYIEALGVLRQAIGAGHVVVPITSVNLIEVTETSAGPSRERLAAFMVETSGNHALIDHVAVRTWEIRNAIVSEYVGGEEVLPTRSEMLRWGAAQAAGVRPGALARGIAENTEVPDGFIAEVMTHPKASEQALASVFQGQGTAAGRQMDETWKQAAETVRATTAELSSSGRWQFEASHWARAPATVQACADLGVEWGAFERWLEHHPNLKRFVAAVPSLDVELTLRLARDRNQQQPIHRNDMKDLLFLGSVIPYADIVVVERAWGHVATATHLDRQFATRICTTPGDLVAALGELDS